MCGIVGIYNWRNGKPVGEGLVRNMAGMLAHRGPDDEGYFVEGNIGLGLKRLSIIDLVTGHQPVHNEDKSICVVNNGEIYNFQELRAQLEQKGHRFYTRSDTEIIVHLYEEFGDDFVNQMNGMFACAVWDAKRKRLILARDRIGIKPLYYTELPGGIVFASELKALLPHPDVKKDIDLAALDAYLALEYVPAPLSIFKGIRKLSGGHMLIADGNGVGLRRWWKPNYHTRKECVPSEKEAEEEIERLLRDSIRLRLIADVPLGVFLSGGIDSTTITALAQQVSGRQMKTFNIGFTDKSFDESRYARHAARVLGTEHYEDILTPQKVLELVPRISDIIDEPFADPSIFPTYLVSKFAHKHIKVVLSGEGGDELFAGYPTYQAHQVAQYYDVLPAVARRIVREMASRLPVSHRNFSLDFNIKRFVNGAGYTPELRHLYWLGAFHPWEKDKLYAGTLKSAPGGEAGVYDAIAAQMETLGLAKGKRRSFLDAISYLDMGYYLQDDLLVKGDRATMANSLEARVPFLDWRLVEYACSLPPSYKIRGLTTKYIYKKMAEKIIPPALARRRKKGFGIPVAKWISAELKGFVLDMLSEKRLRHQGLFHYDYVKRLLEEHFERRKDNRKLLWPLLMFQLWHEHYA